MSLDAIMAKVVVPFVRSSVEYRSLLYRGAPEDLRVFRSEAKCISAEVESRACGEGDPAIEECTQEVFDCARERRLFDDWIATTVGATGEVEEIRHDDTGTFSQSVAQTDGATFSLSGRMPRQEEGSPEVCTALAGAKSIEDGTSWRAEDPQHEGDDGCLRSGDERWPVQVTRANPRERWAQAGRTGSAEGTVSTNEAAAEIWRAIEKKVEQVGHRTTRTILAVSVGIPGFHGLRHVVEEFRRAYGPRLKEQVTFPEVWLVGYTPETTYRVHP
jgi:hypothetical protein